MANDNDIKKAGETKKKKKTSVVLPGSISDLVHDLQNGGQSAAQAPKTPQNDDKNNANSLTSYDQPQNAGDQQYSGANQGFAQDQRSWQQPAAQPVANQDVRVGGASPYGGAPTSPVSGLGASEPSPAPVYANGERGQNRPLGPQPAPRPVSDGRGRPVKQDRMKEYEIVRDNGQGSWELFLDLAKQYRDCGGKLATIYIDGNLKNILDRMKYAGPEKLSTSAILSSIVTRFIYDHEQEIRKSLFENNIF